MLPFNRAQRTPLVLLREPPLLYLSTAERVRPLHAGNQHGVLNRKDFKQMMSLSVKSSVCLVGLIQVAILAVAQWTILPAKPLATMDHRALSERMRILPFATNVSKTGALQHPPLAKVSTESDLFLRSGGHTDEQNDIIGGSTKPLLMIHIG